LIDKSNKTKRYGSYPEDVLGIIGHRLRPLTYIHA